jgi:hypothetical protein
LATQPNGIVVGSKREAAAEIESELVVEERQ